MNDNNHRSLYVEEVVVVVLGERGYEEENKLPEQTPHSRETKKVESSVWLYSASPPVL